MDSQSFVDRNPSAKGDKEAISKASKAIFRGRVKSEELGVIRKAHLRQVSLLDMIKGQTAQGSGSKSLLQLEGLVFIYQPEVSSFVNEGIELSVVSEEIPGETEPLCTILFRASDYVKSVLNLQWTVNTHEISDPRKSPIYFTYRTLQNIHNVVLGKITGGIIGHWKSPKDNVRTHKFSSPSGYTKIYPGEYALDISHIKYYYAGGSFIVQSSSDLKNFKAFKNFLENELGPMENSTVFDILSRLPALLRNSVLKILQGKGDAEDMTFLLKYLRPMQTNVHIPSISYRDLLGFTKEEVSTLTYFNTGDEVEEPPHLSHNGQATSQSGAKAPLF
ncbi:hypothetical protein [Cereal chlorotic mottle virus]|uniref:Uncharacterized protein n=1 Tax=Cereal chlorotic mottle virus TaxID=2964312 RepID=A0A976X977_9RHAB|nr:hypothetical protein [Cereal chlorotic mottle virus]